MKILLLTLNQIQQGTYWRAYHLGRRLAARGHDVTLLATAARNRFTIKVTESAGVKIVETPDLWRGMFRSGYDPWNTLRRLLWLRGQNFDLVHGFEARPTVIYPALKAAQSNQAPLILDWADWFGRGGSVEERTNPFLRVLLRPIETYFEEHFRPQADGNTVINSTLYHRALALGIDPSKIMLLPNGSDTQRIHPLPQTEARVKCNLPIEAKIIGYMGTIFKRDAELLAEAFDQLQALIPQTRLLVMGRCPIDLHKLVKYPDLVHQTGIVTDDQLVAFLACCDLFWLPQIDSPANRGRLPLKFTDYLAAGRPVVATAVGDVAQILQNSNAGILSEPTPHAFSESTALLLGQPDQLQSMGMAARNLAESDYRWNHITDSLLNFYKQTLKHWANVEAD